MRQKTDNLKKVFHTYSTDLEMFFYLDLKYKVQTIHQGHSYQLFCY